MNSGDAPVRIPQPLGRLLGRLPQWPPSAALATVLNLGLAERLDQGALALLRDKVIRIVVRDAGIAFTLSFDGNAFRPRSAAAVADVTISASTWDFTLLAARKEDPDTLFFARRLTMDGDTETGLIVKNMLDAVDLASLTDRLDGPIAPLEELRALTPFRRPAA
jgi:O2-independent ubiquinone biosynthesis accessory factor UbiT